MNQDINLIQLESKSSSIAKTIMFLVLATMLISAQEARANSLTDWLAQPTMSGDWNGVRTSLETLGITPSAYYWGQFAANPIGGQKQGGTLASQFGFGIDVDMGKLASLAGGTLHIKLAYRTGLSDSGSFIGNEVPVQALFGTGQVLRLRQFTYEQLFDDGMVDAQIGFYGAGNSFGVNPLLCDFESDAFCPKPYILTFDENMTTYAGQWGGQIKVNLTHTVNVSTGIFDVKPSTNDAQNGLNVSLGGSTGATIPFQIGWTPVFGPDKLPGHYQIGGYYNTSTVANIADPGIERSGRYGGYIVADQMLFRLKPGTGRGLIAFASGALNDVRTSSDPVTYDVGLILQGPFAARPRDYVSLGFFKASINSRLLKEEGFKLLSEGESQSLQEGEDDVELDYGLSVARWLTVAPLVQYVIDPGAFSFKHVKNAWVFGSQLEVTF
jgi:porin